MPFMRKIVKKSRIFSRTRTAPEISFSTLINLLPLYHLKSTNHPILSIRKKKKRKKRSRSLKKLRKKKTRNLSLLMNTRAISVWETRKMRK